jgi:hypothetical protein
MNKGDERKEMAGKLQVPTQFQRQRESGAPRFKPQKGVFCTVKL